MDPLAEKYYPVSTYVYVSNNPIIMIDPDGRRQGYHKLTCRKPGYQISDCRNKEDKPIKTNYYHEQNEEAIDVGQSIIDTNGVIILQ